MRRTILRFACCILLLCGAVAFGEQDMNVKTLFDLFRGQEKAALALFDDSFLAQVPPEKVIAILNLYQQQLGPLVNVTGRDGQYTLVFEKGTAPASITLNGNQKIIGLWFGHWALNEDSKEKIMAEFQKLPGKVAVCVMKNNEQVLLALNENTPLAAGSTFKLYVLKAVYDQVQTGKIAWDTVIPLNGQNQSLPSGILQEWPDKTPVTLKTLTNLMISISDNTAADLLIDYLGRETIEKYVSPLNRPFLKTAEMFKLKFGADPSLPQKYIAAGAARKREILKDLAHMDLAGLRTPPAPVFSDEIEWFFSARELCQTIHDLRNSDEIRINSGLAAKADWSLAGYKGGSEPGVLQYTHLLRKKDSKDLYALSVTVNDARNPIDEAKVTELTVRLINLIKEWKD
ncbi:beta-lactamase class A [Hydrogenispora ethanolica]|uniref:Beta-lactamase class A n=2 Tax=Hydrogenispora ethanolica TaxID=1082276 RepID=A0A4R1RD03_HYDET|nr:beta-lactamase class A [Hydrogenispora ethanolica]